MIQANYLIQLPISSGEAVRWVTHCVTEAGLNAFRSFDLQSTRALDAYCPCPYHGADACSCQLVVLLVYTNHPCPEQMGEPVTLIIHGHDDQAWIAIEESPDVDNDNPINTQLVQALQQQMVVDSHLLLFQNAACSPDHNKRMETQDEQSFAQPRLSRGRH